MDKFPEQRQKLIEWLRWQGIRDIHVLSVMAHVPREHFVGEAWQKLAYADRALPLQMGQTISQPFMVALMTQALHLTGSERVLEIGTGSGYQTAILSHLAAYVYSMERYQELALYAAQRLNQLERQNISIFIGDGTLGWEVEAPYARILVTAGGPEVPPALVEQLEMGGMLVMPVGGQERQELQVIQRVPGGTRMQSLGSCTFVPLVGAEGWHE